MNFAIICADDKFKIPKLRFLNFRLDGTLTVPGVRVGVPQLKEASDRTTQLLLPPPRRRDHQLDACQG